MKPVPSIGVTPGQPKEAEITGLPSPGESRSPCWTSSDVFASIRYIFSRFGATS